jgi:hypothetical protein
MSIRRRGAISRKTIEQKYRLGKTISAIAEYLNWKPDSVKVALSRARKQLADCINGKLRLHEAVYVDSSVYVSRPDTFGEISWSALVTP